MEYTARGLYDSEGMMDDDEQKSNYEEEIEKNDRQK